MNTYIFNARAHSRSRGFSMVELMVALVVGLFLIGAMITVLMTSSSTGKSRERASDLKNNGRYALDLMKRETEFTRRTTWSPAPRVCSPRGKYRAR